MLILEKVEEEECRVMPYMHMHMPAPKSAAAGNFLHLKFEISNPCAQKFTNINGQMHMSPELGRARQN